MLKIVFGILLVVAYVFIAYNVYEAYDEAKNSQEEVKQDNVKKVMVDVKEPVIDISQKNDEAKNEEDTNNELVSLGEFKLTAYCPCEICTGKWALDRPKDRHGNDIVYGAIGELLKEGYSIAVDPDVIPYGTEVIINGKTYKAQDCGGAIKGNRIDVYMNDHSIALEFGVQYAEVFMKVE